MRLEDQQHVQNTLKLRLWGYLGSPLGTLGRRLGALCEAMPSQRAPRTPPRVPEGSILDHFWGVKKETNFNKNLDRFGVAYLRAFGGDFELHFDRFFVTFWNNSEEK